MHRLADTRRRHRQGGAVIVTVALVLLFLLGFMGIALDFGRLFITKTELQTAMDSCALAAAQELDGASDSFIRAKNAGRTAGNLNKVYFQSASAGIIDTEIKFSDSLVGGYSTDFTPHEKAKYAKCTHTKTGIAPWLLQAMSSFSGNSTFEQPQNVWALAVASRVPSQTNCAVPVGLCKKTPDYQPGEWLAGTVNSAGAATGQFRWLDFTGNGGGARELKDVLEGEGQCDLPGIDTVTGKPGNISSAAFAYNTRFGIYKGSEKRPNDGIPDLTGYAWYLKTPPAQPPYPNKYPLFLEKRLTNAPYQGDQISPDTSDLSIVGNVYSDSLGTVGANRRVVMAPIVDCADFDGLTGSDTIKIDSIACVLLLHPIKNGAGPKSETMWVEYIGKANDINSPCSTIGLGGGDLGGSMVSVLVQ